MPLRIGESKFDPTILKASSLFEKYPELKDYSRKCLDEKKLQKFDVLNGRFIYVFQGEYAVISPKEDYLDWILTDDTTTCITGIVRHSNSGITSLAHYDRNCESDVQLKYFCDLFRLMIDCIETEFPCHTKTDYCFDLFLIGGYNDEQNTSQNILLSLLNCFHNTNYQINLCCAFTADLNTKHITLENSQTGKSAPIVYGAAVNVKTGQIVNAILNRETLKQSMKKTNHHIPLFEVRQACVSYGTYPSYRSIYNPRSRMAHFDPETFAIRSYTFTFKSYFHYILSLSDFDILQNFSTSPSVEPGHFVENIRSVIQYLIHNKPDDISNTNFPHKRVRQFRLTSVSAEPLETNIEKLIWEEIG